MDGDGARARAAAANNADLYAAVFAAQGRRFCRDAVLFRAIDPPPSCYSSVTTLDPGATAEQLAAIDALRAEGRADVGVKDGFCRLDRDLAARGLAVLFEASWLWAPAAAFEAAAGAAGWERVTTPAGAHGVGGGLGCGGFADRDPGVSRRAAGEPGHRHLRPAQRVGV